MGPNPPNGGWGRAASVVMDRTRSAGGLMLWCGSSPLAVSRNSMWGFLMFAGVAWLAIGWSVLRLEPADIVEVAGPVIFFGALCEAVRALAGTRTWWLNAAMAALFTATGVIVLVDQDATYTTP